MVETQQSAAGWAAWVLAQETLDHLVKRGLISGAEAIGIESTTLDKCRGLSQTAELPEDRAVWVEASVMLEAAIQRRLARQ